MTANHETVTRVVVGYDGSVTSEAALDVAIAAARVRAVPLLVVTVIDVPVQLSTTLDADWAAALDVLERARARAIATLCSSRVQLRVDVGRVAAQLLKLCQASDLLVVGEPRQRHAPRLTLRPELADLAQRAPCPVAVASSAGHGPGPRADKSTSS